MSFLVNRLVDNFNFTMDLHNYLADNGIDDNKEARQELFRLVVELFHTIDHLGPRSLKSLEEKLPNMMDSLRDTFVPDNLYQYLGEVLEKPYYDA